MQNLTLRFITSDFIEVSDQNVHQKWHIKNSLAEIKENLDH